MRRCTAKNRSGKRCGRQAAPGFKVCRSHGGDPKSGRPLIHGRYSERLAPRLKAWYEQALSSEEREKLRQLDDELALNLAQIQAVLGDGFQCFTADVAKAARAVRDVYRAKRDAGWQKRLESSIDGFLTAYVLMDGEVERFVVLNRLIDQRQRLLMTDANQERARKEGLTLQEGDAIVAAQQDAFEEALKAHGVGNIGAILHTAAAKFKAKVDPDGS